MLIASAGTASRVNFFDNAHIFVTIGSVLQKMCQLRPLKFWTLKVP